MQRPFAPLGWLVRFGAVVSIAVVAPGAAHAVCILTCPANITATATSRDGAPISYGAVVQNGCTGPVEQTSGLPSGAVFPPGTTTCSFRNSVETSSTCSFTVAVSVVSPAGAPAAGPLGLVALAASLAACGAWVVRRRRD